jgi:hypothetical protein
MTGLRVACASALLLESLEDIIDLDLRCFAQSRPFVQVYLIDPSGKTGALVTWRGRIALRLKSVFEVIDVFFEALRDDFSGPFVVQIAIRASLRSLILILMLELQ